MYALVTGTDFAHLIVYTGYLLLASPRLTLVRWRWKAVISTKRAVWIPVIHLSCGPPVVGTWRWWKYSPSGVKSTPKNQIIMA